MRILNLIVIEVLTNRKMTVNRWGGRKRKLGFWLEQLGK